MATYIRLMTFQSTARTPAQLGPNLILTREREAEQVFYVVYLVYQLRETCLYVFRGVIFCRPRLSKIGGAGRMVLLAVCSIWGGGCRAVLGWYFVADVCMGDEWVEPVGCLSSCL